MIRFDRVTFTYPGAVRSTLRDVDLDIAEGELCLVVGESGVGKSTLLRAVNGLVPHFTGGRLDGAVRVAGRDTRTSRPRDLADVVGLVGQDPRGGFVTDTVEDELAYVMENLGVATDVMRRRVEDALDLLGLSELRGRALGSLSAGQQQRVAIGAALTAHPRVLVLDEPTSALDPPAAEDVLAAVQRLVHDVGLTVLLAEHRLERAVQFADSIVLLPGAGAAPVTGTPVAVMGDSRVVPPVVALGRLASWSPLPLSIRDARRVAGGFRSRLRALHPVDQTTAPGEVLASTRHLGASYGPVTALRRVDLDLHRGELVGLMGRNGSGKTTLLRHLVGLAPVTAGSVDVAGHQPARLAPRELVRVVGLVPHEPGRLLYASSVAEECATADREHGLTAGTTAAAMERISLGLDPAQHPSDLSEGQRLMLALAVVLAPAPPLVLLDEPTRGLDYAAKARLGSVLRGLAGAGCCVVLSTHDVELAAELTSRTVVLADGEVVADGPTREVIRHSPAFAPQVTKVLGEPWLTVAEVERALAG